MNEAAALLGIGTALCIGAASPGPSFVMVARTAASAGRSHGLNAALGMGCGGALYAVASLLGLNALFAAVPAFYLALKLLGGIYLAYLGWRIWRGARQALEIPSEAPPAHSSHARRSLLLGFTTQVSNPKTAIVYASIFAAFLPSSPSLAFQLAVVAVVFCIEAGWYALVAVALSATGPRNTYLRCKKWVDRIAGAVLGVLGLRLVISTAVH